MLGACSNIETVAVVIGAYVFPFIIITAAQQSIMASGIWTGNMLLILICCLRVEYRPFGMEDISQMSFSIAMKTCMKIVI